MKEEKFVKAAELIRNSKYTIAFTGAGISVESEIPPFRGENGLWNKYNPRVLDINYFHENPVESWKINKEMFYEVFNKAYPNNAHKVLAKMEENNLLKTIITQNIDNMHQEAGNKDVLEFHGNASMVVCTKCDKKYKFNEEFFTDLPPHCKECNGLLKPDFVFFGEDIPEPARTRSFMEAEKSELVIVIGTTGEVQPAAMIPIIANNEGANIIEVNTKKTNYTDSITDVYLQGKAAEVMDKLSSIIM